MKVEMHEHDRDFAFFNLVLILNQLEALNENFGKYEK